MAHLEPLLERGLSAAGDESPGLTAQGRIALGTMEIVQDLARELVVPYLEHGDELPSKLQVATLASGEVHVRILINATKIIRNLEKRH